MAQGMLTGLEVWLIAGGLIAALFLTVGIDRIDEDARMAYVFRPLLVPGILLIWPLVLWRWWQIETERSAWLSRYQPVRSFYGAAIAAMCIAVVFFLAAGLSVRQSWPADVAPVKLSEAGG